MWRASEEPDLKLSDIHIFLEVYTKAKAFPARTFRDLFARLNQPVTTTIGQLERVIKYLFTNRKDLVSTGKGAVFEALFVPTEDGLVPTAAADDLDEHFRAIEERCSIARQAFVARHAGRQQRRAVVRLGMPQTIAYRLVACALSRWHELFGGELELRVEIDNSVALLRRLDAGGGVLDAVIAYRSEDRRSRPTEACLEQGLHVCFRSLSYPLDMVILSNPGIPLLTKDGKDQNHNYLGEMKKNLAPFLEPTKKRKPRADAEDLTPYEALPRGIDPRDINFPQTPLIVVPSYSQPAALKNLVEYLRPRFELREAPYYDEALALARMSQGLAIVNDSYCLRRHVTAFRMEPREDFRRWLGVYYDARRGIHEQTYRLLCFLHQYILKFGQRIRAGEPPSYGDREYEVWCKKYCAGEIGLPPDWPGTAKEEFPILLP
ncbi:MAG TPA: LysR family transcriptional regulator [Gemmataceae bacterium]|nr:LysR family transcriptional regulator [Gemmataceae bacterium]